MIAQWYIVRPLNEKLDFDPRSLSGCPVALQSVHINRPDKKQISGFGLPPPKSTFKKEKKKKKNTLPAAFAVIHLHNIHSYRKTYSEHF